MVAFNSKAAFNNKFRSILQSVATYVGQQGRSVFLEKFFVFDWKTQTRNFKVQRERVFPGGFGTNLIPTPWLRPKIWIPKQLITTQTCRPDCYSNAAKMGSYSLANCKVNNPPSLRIAFGAKKFFHSSQMNRNFLLFSLCLFEIQFSLEIHFYLCINFFG